MDPAPLLPHHPSDEEAQHDMAPLEDGLLKRGLNFVLAHFDIKTWDLLIVGDGSGCSWDIGCGWAAAIVDRASMSRKLLWGGLSTGTIGIAELMPAWHSLRWFEANYGKKRRATKKDGLLEVHILSDNNTAVNQGNKRAQRHANPDIWAAIDALLRSGYVAHWHHTDRNIVGLHSLADHVSRYARLLVQTPQLGDMVPELPSISVYDINPF